MITGRPASPTAAALLIGLLAAVTTGLALPRSAAAATITLVDCPSSGLQTLELWQAILEANDESAHPGLDTIQLAPGCAYPVSGPYPGTSYALPPITSSIEILGRGATITTGPNSGSLEPAGLFDIEAGAGLVGSDLTLFDDVGIQGGATYVRNAGDVTFARVTISGHSSVAGPALMNLAGGNFTFLDSSVTGYSYNSGTDSVGSAVDNAGSFYAIGSRFMDNNVSIVRQGIPWTPMSRSIVNRGHMELTDSSVHVSFGTANAEPRARGIENSGSLVLLRTEVSGHAFEANGAGIHSSGTLDVDESTISGNSSIGTGARGGGIFSTGPLRIVNSVLENSADRGGDLYNFNLGSISFSIARDVENDPFAALSINGSILAQCVGLIQDGGANLKTGATSCPGVIGDPKLVPGPFTGGHGYFYRLGPGSAAVDAAGTSCPSSDQRGFPRPGGPACDIGPYENQVPVAPSQLVLSQGANPSSSGDLGFDWPNASDADGDPITYHLYGRDGDDLLETQLYSGTTSGASFVGLAEGTYQLRVVATDGLATSGSAGLSGVTVDLTAPTAPTATADRVPDFTATDGTGWYRDSVDVSFSGSSDPALADGSSPSGIALVTATQSITTSGAHLVTGSATDHAGNASLDASVTVHVDADGPTVGFGTCPATSVLGRPLGVAWSASDAESGLASAAAGQVQVDTSTVGTRTLQVTSLDHVGHPATATCVVRVIYDFTGYFAPLTNAPAINSATAGKTITVSFSLGGKQGLGIFAAGYPASAPASCTSTALLTAGTPTVGTAPSLVYAGGRYTYQWRTDKSWAGTCRQLIIKLNDGTYHQAIFSFK